MAPTSRSNKPNEPNDDGSPDPAAAPSPAAAGDGEPSDDTPPADAEARTDAGAELADDVDVDDLADEVRDRHALAPHANVVTFNTDEDGNLTGDVVHHDGHGAVFAL